MKIIKQAFVFITIIFFSTFVLAAHHEHAGNSHDSMGHSSKESSEMDHSKMGHEMAGHVTAKGVGIIHRVSRLNRMVNITHEPMPELKWPEMTMDLPVAESVDLKNLKTGEKIKFELKLGKDKKYIITNIMK